MRPAVETLGRWRGGSRPSPLPVRPGLRRRIRWFREVSRCSSFRQRGATRIGREKCMEEGQHLVAIEVAREAGGELPAIGRKRPVGARLLLEELVNAALLLLHPLARGGALEQIASSFRRGHALEEPSAAVGFGGEACRVGAQVEVATGQKKRVGESDLVIHAVDGDHGGGAVLAALPDVADAFGLAEGAAEKGVDTGVTDAVFTDIEPHVVGRVAEPCGKGDTVHIVGGYAGVGHGEVEFAVTETIAAAAGDLALTVGDHFGDRRGAAVLHQRLAKIGALAGNGGHRGLHAVDRAGEEFLGGTFLVCPASRRDGDEFPDRRRLAILDLGLFEKRAGHGRYSSSFFPNFSPPSAMVTPREGRWNAWSSCNEATRSETSRSSWDMAVAFLRLEAIS